MIHILSDKATASEINIRPNQGNRSMTIQSEELRQKTEVVARAILGE